MNIIYSKVGKPISTDSVTAIRGQFLYARVLIEIDASKDLVKSTCFKLPSGKLRSQPFLYEFEPKFCAHCKVFGHSVKGCQAKKLKQESITAANGKASESRQADGLNKASDFIATVDLNLPLDGSAQVMPETPKDLGPSDQFRANGSSQDLGHLAALECEGHVH